MVGDLGVLQPALTPPPPPPSNPIKECSVEFPDGLPCALEGGAMQAWYMARGLLGVLGMDSTVRWIEGGVFGASAPAAP